MFLFHNEKFFKDFFILKEIYVTQKCREDGNSPKGSIVSYFWLLSYFVYTSNNSIFKGIRLIEVMAQEGPVPEIPVISSASNEIAIGTYSNYYLRIHPEIDNNELPSFWVGRPIYALPKATLKHAKGAYLPMEDIRYDQVGHFCVFRDWFGKKKWNFPKCTSETLNKKNIIIIFGVCF